MYIFSGLRLYSILFRFRICKFKKGWNACVAVWIQLDNILPWVDRDFSGNFSSIVAQLSWQIYKSRRSVFLKVSFLFFYEYSYKSFFLPFNPHPHARMVFIWQMLFSESPPTIRKGNSGRISFYLFCKFICWVGKFFISINFNLGQNIHGSRKSLSEAINPDLTGSMFVHYSIDFK